MKVRTSLADLLTTTASRRPEAPALTAGDQTLSYGELDEEVRRFAEGWAAAGGRRGDRVAIFLEKRAETVIAIFGTALAGGVVVPINPVLKGYQVAHIVKDSGAGTFVTSPGRWSAIEAEAGACPSIERLILVDPQGDRPISALVVVGWEDLLAIGRGSQRIVDADLAVIIYTSGSTGAPKGVALSHRNLVAGAESVNEYLGNSEADVILSVLPLSFDAGLSQLTTGFATGAHVVLLNYLLPRDVITACVRHRVTAVTAVPPLWTQLADQDWSGAGPALRVIATTGGRLPLATLRALRSRIPGAEIFLMYGLTEAFRSTFLPPAEVDSRPDSIGKAIPNAEIIVVRPDGSECEPGEPGELVHRGALVALGYWNDPERTAERFRLWPPTAEHGGGWRQQERAVWSGDTVVRDEAGYLSFVARADDMIKRSGYRVSPTEVEEAALLTGVVTEAVALGRDEPGIGHRIVLAVTGPGGEVDVAALRSGLRAALPAFMVPDEFVVLDSIPRNANGKYDRPLLKERHA